MYFTTTTCFGCKAEIEAAAGNFYCDGCIADQEKAHADEMVAFDAFHRFADRIARGEYHDEMKAEGEQIAREEAECTGTFYADAGFAHDEHCPVHHKGDYTIAAVDEDEKVTVIAQVRKIEI